MGLAVGMNGSALRGAQRCRCWTLTGVPVPRSGYLAGPLLRSHSPGATRYGNHQCQEHHLVAGRGQDLRHWPRLALWERAVSRLAQSRTRPAALGFTAPRCRSRPAQPTSPPHSAGVPRVLLRRPCIWSAPVGVVSSYPTPCYYALYCLAPDWQGVLSRYSSVGRRPEVTHLEPESASARDLPEMRARVPL